MGGFSISKERKTMNGIVTILGSAKDRKITEIGATCDARRKLGFVLSNLIYRTKVGYFNG